MSREGATRALASGLGGVLLMTLLALMDQPRTESAWWRLPVVMLGPAVVALLLAAPEFRPGVYFRNGFAAAAGLALVAAVFGALGASDAPGWLVFVGTLLVALALAFPAVMLVGLVPIVRAAVRRTD